MYKDITVAVPTDKIAEFYTMFAQWLGSADDVLRRPQKWGPGDRDKAILVYAKLTPAARDILNVFLDSKLTEIAADKVARKARLKTGIHGLAGTLAWPGRHCYAAGREPFLETRVDDDQGTFFRMKKEVADLLGQAREVVE